MDRETRASLAAGGTSTTAACTSASGTTGDEQQQQQQQSTQTNKKNESDVRAVHELTNQDNSPQILSSTNNNNGQQDHQQSVNNNQQDESNNSVSAGRVERQQTPTTPTSGSGLKYRRKRSHVLAKAAAAAAQNQGNNANSTNTSSLSAAGAAGTVGSPTNGTTAAAVGGIGNAASSTSTTSSTSTPSSSTTTTSKTSGGIDPSTTSAADTAAATISSSTTTSNPTSGSMTSGTAAANTTTTPNSSSKTRGWTPWNDANMNLFFDALKQHGKDFEAVKNYMSQNYRSSKPGGSTSSSSSGSQQQQHQLHQIKNYDQIRNFYYNTLNKITNKCPEFISDALVGKEAKELFLLINYGEFRRRMGNVGIKPHLDRFKELILKGYTSIKLSSGKGKAPRIIRTPNCASLRKYCDRDDHPRALSSSICLELTPRTFGDKYWVLECEQNPMVRLMLTPNEPVLAYVQLLQEKWITSEIRSKETDLGEDILKDLPKVILFPHKDTVLRSAYLRPSKSSVSTGVSWEKCAEKYREEAEQKQQQQQLSVESSSATDGNPSATAAVNSEDSNDSATAATATAAEDHQNVPSTTEDSNDGDKSEGERGTGGGTDATEADGTHKPDAGAADGGGTNTNNNWTEDSSSVHLDPSSLRSNGISADNLPNITAGQLSLMCNISSHIRMQYAVEHRLKPPLDQPTQAWKSLMTLLRRDYGDTLCRTAAQQESNLASSGSASGRSKSPPSHHQAAQPAASAATMAENRAANSRKRSSKTKQSRMGEDGGSFDPSSEKSARLSSTSTPGNQPPPVVVDESEAFMQQYAQLFGKGKIVKRQLIPTPKPPPTRPTANNIVGEHSNADVIVMNRRQEPPAPQAFQQQQQQQIINNHQQPMTPSNLAPVVINNQQQQTMTPSNLTPVFINNQQQQQPMTPSNLTPVVINNQQQQQPMTPSNRPVAITITDNQPSSSKNTVVNHLHSQHSFSSGKMNPNYTCITVAGNNQPPSQILAIPETQQSVSAITTGSTSVKIIPVEPTTTLSCHSNDLVGLVRIESNSGRLTPPPPPSSHQINNNNTNQITLMAPPQAATDFSFLSPPKQQQQQQPQQQQQQHQPIQSSTNPIQSPTLSNNANQEGTTGARVESRKTQKTKVVSPWKPGDIVETSNDLQFAEILAQMNQQSSIDFAKNFEPLLMNETSSSSNQQHRDGGLSSTSLETPKKLH